MEPGNLQRLCGTPGARSGQARPQSKGSCPSYDDFSPVGGSGVREDDGWGEVAQVRHDACRWSLETCRCCAGPPGPDLAKRNLNPRIPARVRTISGRCGGARAREGVGWGEVAQVRHDACRWSLETCRGCAGPPGPDLAKRDLNPRIPARVTTISGRFQSRERGRVLDGVRCERKLTPVRARAARQCSMWTGTPCCTSRR